MNNFKGLLRDKKLIVISVIILLSFFLCVLMNIQSNFIISDTSVYYQNAGIVSAHIASGDVLEQEFVLQEGDEGIAVLFCTYSNPVTAGTINVEVYDETETIITSYSVPANAIGDNKYYNFLIGENTESLTGQRVKLRLTFSDVDNQIIGVFASNSDTLDCAYTINGVEQCNDLVLKGINQDIKWSYKDIRLYYLFAFVLCISLLVYRIKWVDVKSRLQEVVVSWNELDKRKVVLAIGLLIITVLASSVIEHFMMQEKGYVNPYRWSMLCVIIATILYSIAYKKYIWKYAHIYYFIVSMLIGVVSIVSLPVTHVSWDEQIHYYRTTYMSWGASDNISAADNYVASIQSPLVRGPREEVTAMINSIEAAGMIEYSENMEVSYVAYIPPAITMSLGRMIGCSVYEVYMLGKLGNLFCYSLFLALAIWNFKGRGKLITAALGLIPVSLFVAISYSYDWWVISLPILGFSIFIGEIQSKGYVSTKKMLLSVCVIALGMLSKAVYFPMMFPMMLLRKEKYENSKRDRWIPFVGMLFLLATFILPILFSGAGQGDLRGGEGVNASEQLVFVLSNFSEYLKILFGFFKGYLSLDSVQYYLGHMAYLGAVEYISVIFVIICIATLIDNSDQMPLRKDNSILRVGNLVGVFGAIVLVATALYIAYTPVGHTTVNGCQFRYLLPVLFSFLFFTGEYDFKVSEDVKKNFLVFEVISLMLIYFNAWNNFVIMQY